MAATKLATFEFRNGERRTYKDVTRIDDSRPHIVLVYCGATLIAQLNRREVVKYYFEEPAPTPTPS